MKRIPLGKHLYALVDDSDFWTLAEERWLALAQGFSGTDRPRWVAARANPARPGSYILMHRLIAQPPDGLEIDHVNGDSLDNRRANLRACSRSDNTCNVAARRTNKCGLKGVYLLKGAKEIRWAAEIARNGVRYKLGKFATKEDASAAYNEAAARLHGEFMRTEPFDIDKPPK